MKNIFWTILAVALSACSEPYRGFVLDGKIQFPGRDNGADDSFSLLGRRADGYG